MKTSCSLGQIIDFEYFLHEDASRAPEELHLRDREIGLQLTGDSLGREPDNPKLISDWVRSRRQQEFWEKKQDSPGTLFKKSRSLATTLISFKGLLSGLFAGWAFFAYAGTTPINVLQFLLFFVFSQLIIAGLLFIGLVARKLIPGITLPNTSFHLLHRLGSSLFAFINKKWFANIGGSKRESVRHAYGIIRSKNKLYGSLFYWPIFSLAQLFGITFNIGLLTTSFVKIVTSDLAFGWQSTLQLTSSAIEKVVHLLALPWAWLLPPGIGTPTLSEIEGSRIILKDGIYHLTTGDLVAWWPFLLLCLLFYGLSVRIVFYVSGKFLERKALAEVKFISPGCQALVRRMRSPVVSTQAAVEVKEPSARSTTNLPPVTLPLEHPATAVPQIILIPDDIYESCPPDEIQAFMQKKDFGIIEKHRFMLGYEEDRKLLESLAGLSWNSGQGVVIIMESWMVPLVDFLVFLREIRHLSTPETIIEIALTGQAGESTFTDVNRTDFDIWLKKIESIGDPYIHLAPIRGISQ